MRKRTTDVCQHGTWNDNKHNLLWALMAVLLVAGCSQIQEQPSNRPEAIGRQATSKDNQIEAPQPPVETTIDGVISDSMCGFDHSAMLKTGSMGTNDGTCSLRCAEAGSKFVLANATSNKLYRLSDQASAKQFAGKLVSVTGYLDSKANLIRVRSISLR